MKVSTHMVAFPRIGGAKSAPPPADPPPAQPPVAGDESASGAGTPLLPSVQALSRFATAPMDTAMARNVKFNTSSPQGYYFPQVEKYVEQVADAIAWFEDAKYGYEKAIHDLQVELDHQTYDAQRLRTEIEVFKVQGSPMVNADGSYMTESQQAAEAETAQHIATLEAQLGQATARITELEVEIGRAHAYIASQDQQVAAFREQAQAAVAARDEAHAHAAAAEERAVAAEARVAQCDAVILALQQDNERLQAAVVAAAEAVQGVPVDSVPPVGAEAVAVEPSEMDGYLGLSEEPDPDLPVIPDSELPPGVTLPVAPQAAEYQPVTPGTPLANPGVPQHVWAPELDGAPGPQAAVDPDAVPQPTLRRPS